MVSTFKVLLDKALEDFEETWCQAASGGVGILKFLDSFGFSKPYEVQAYIELAQIDLERSWMNWHKELPEKSQRLSPQELLKQFQLLPRLRHYQAAFCHESTVSIDQWTEVARSELAARNEWGDGIGSMHFEHYYGISLQDDRFHQPNFVQCDISVKSLSTKDKLPIRGTSLVGRQRRVDKRDYFAERTPDGNRIVIANRFQSQISRQQLIIHLLHPKYAIVVNISKISPIGIYLNQTLQPNESAIIALPHMLGIADRRLLIS
jgi:hypothetical protein